MSRMQEAGVTTSKVSCTNNQGYRQLRSMTFANDPNLYRCIFQSRKPDAEMLQNWVFEDVLPQIRKTGGYKKLPGLL